MWNLFSSLKTDLQPCRKGHMVPEELQLHSWGQVGWQRPEKRACGHLPCLIRDTSKTFHLGQAIPKHTHKPIRTADSYGATLWVGFFRLKKCLSRGGLSFADSLGYLQRNTIDSSVPCLPLSKNALSLLPADTHTNFLAITSSCSPCQVPLCTHPFPC